MKTLKTIKQRSNIAVIMMADLINLRVQSYLSTFTPACESPPSLIATFPLLQLQKI